MVAVFSAKNVLLPVRGDLVNEDAFRLACTLAKGAKGKIRAIYVIEVKRELPLDAEIADETSRGEEALAQIESLAKAEKCPLDADILQARQAGPAIVQEAASKEADVIVVGVECRPLDDGITVGQTASYVLEHAHCPVLLWRAAPARHDPPQRD